MQPTRFGFIIFFSKLIPSMFQFHFFSIWFCYSLILLTSQSVYYVYGLDTIRYSFCSKALLFWHKIIVLNKLSHIWDDNNSTLFIWFLFFRLSRCSSFFSHIRLGLFMSRILVLFNNEFPFVNSKSDFHLFFFLSINLLHFFSSLGWCLLLFCARSSYDG